MSPMLAVGDRVMFRRGDELAETIHVISKIDGLVLQFDPHHPSGIQPGDEIVCLDHPL